MGKIITFTQSCDDSKLTGDIFFHACSFDGIYFNAVANAVSLPALILVCV